MRRILITGAGSYIGTSVDRWLSQHQDTYQVDTIDMKDDMWRKKDFSGYDVVFHVAGIAHVSSDPKLEDLYFKVNRDLAIETAKKAKADGVKQFIFMSSIIVYGDSTSTIRIINRETRPKPSNFYGQSKLQAEEGIISLDCDDFKTVILRPPVIYGKGSKGNYPKLAKMAQILLIFPDIDNQRSMLHIDNLCEFIKAMIDNQENGVFFPQNDEYVKISNLVKMIAEIHGKNIRLTKLFNLPILLIGRHMTLIDKVFGNLVYEQNLSSYKTNYCIRKFPESIKLTEIN